MPTQETGQTARVVERIVDALEKNVFNKHLSAGKGEVLPCGLENLREWVAEGPRYEGRAGAVVGCVEGDGEIDLGLFPRERPDPGRDTHG